jgi:hypothetical protein
MLPGVPPAASEPKINESSSISESLAYLSNSSCRKELGLWLMLLDFAEEVADLQIWIKKDSCASKVSRNLYATVRQPR